MKNLYSSSIVSMKKTTPMVAMETRLRSTMSHSSGLCIMSYSPAAKITFQNKKLTFISM